MSVDPVPAPADGAAVADGGPETVAVADGGPETGDVASGGAGASKPVVPTGEQWRLVDVIDVELLLPASYPEVVLRERPLPNRTLRVPVGMAEGTAIAFAWRRVATPRPLTHELFVDALVRHNVRIEAVRVTAVHDGTFLAELDTTGPSGRQVVPCRTSDALAVALRTRPVAPILVADWVFDGERPG